MRSALFFLLRLVAVLVLVPLGAMLAGAFSWTWIWPDPAPSFDAQFDRFGRQLLTGAGVGLILAAAAGIGLDARRSPRHARIGQTAAAIGLAGLGFLAFVYAP